MIFAIAQAKPHFKIQLIGPIFCKLPTNIPKNVEIFPPCVHSVAISFMETFSIGLIPFKRNRLTKSVDPIKYYEYRAMGLPVLSSSFGEMKFHKNDPGVFFIEQLECFYVCSVIDAALAHQDPSDEVKNFRICNAWETRFATAEILPS